MPLALRQLDLADDTFVQVARVAGAEELLQMVQQPEQFPVDPGRGDQQRAVDAAVALDRVRVAGAVVEQGPGQHGRPFPRRAAPEEQVVVGFARQQRPVHEEGQLGGDGAAGGGRGHGRRHRAAGGAVSAVTQPR